MQNSILLQNVSPEQFSELIVTGFRNALDDIIKKVGIPLLQEDLMTREDTCKFLQIDPSTLWDWTKKGKILAYGIGNRRYYKRTELLRCLKPLQISVI